MTNPSFELVVAPEEAGSRIDRYLAGVEEVGSRAQAAKLIESGAVTVGGRAARKSQLLESGDVVTVELAEAASVDASEPAVPFSIVYEDPSLLVVDKPAGLVVHPGPGNRTGTLSQALAGIARGGDPERPGIVHRLDK